MLSAVGAEHGAYGLLVEVVGVYVQLLERIRRYHAERDIRCPAEREARQAPARRVNKPVEAAAQELAQKQRDKQQAQRIVCLFEIGNTAMWSTKSIIALQNSDFFRLSRISPSLSAEAR